MKYSATDKAILAEIEQAGQVSINEIYNRFSRRWNACEKLVKAGLLIKTDGGFSYTATYTFCDNLKVIAGRKVYDISKLPVASIPTIAAQINREVICQ